MGCLSNSRGSWSRRAPPEGTGSRTTPECTLLADPKPPCSGLPGSFSFRGSIPALKYPSCRDTSEGPSRSSVWSTWESPATFSVSCSWGEDLSGRVGSQVVGSVVLSFSLSPERNPIHKNYVLVMPTQKKQNQHYTICCVLLPLNPKIAISFSPGLLTPWGVAG